MEPHWKADFVSHADEYARMVYMVGEESYSPNQEISALDRLTGYVESLLESERKELLEKVEEIINSFDGRVQGDGHPAEGLDLLVEYLKTN